MRERPLTAHCALQGVSVLQARLIERHPLLKQLRNLAEAWQDAARAEQDAEGTPEPAANATAECVVLELRLDCLHWLLLE